MLIMHNLKLCLWTKEYCWAASALTLENYELNKLKDFFYYILCLCVHYISEQELILL